MPLEYILDIHCLNINTENIGNISANYSFKKVTSKYNFDFILNVNDNSVINIIRQKDNRLKAEVKIKNLLLFFI